jgi:hypothetical protein
METVAADLFQYLNNKKLINIIVKYSMNEKEAHRMSKTKTNAKNEKKELMTN